jgi:hypothetical protein
MLREMEVQAEGHVITWACDAVLASKSVITGVSLFKST